MGQPAAAAEVDAAQTAPSLPTDVVRITALATSGQGGTAAPPWSAAHPYVNLYTIEKPAIATVTGNFRLTGEGASSDIRHIVLDFGGAAFPVLEGQTIGIVPPGRDAHGRPHHLRLYSVASPREGERPRYNNLALTVKRVTEDHDRQPVAGVASNYLCDLAKGDEVNVVGPYGTTFLMPNHPGSSLLMVCTGTGSAPMRAMTERRRRRIAQKEGGELMLFFGARTADELPYFGPLQKLPQEFIDINFAFSRVAGYAEAVRAGPDPRAFRRRRAAHRRRQLPHLRLRPERHGGRRRPGVPRRLPRARRRLGRAAAGAAGAGPLSRRNVLIDRRRTKQPGRTSP